MAIATLAASLALGLAWWSGEAQRGEVLGDRGTPDPAGSASSGPAGAASPRPTATGPPAATAPPEASPVAVVSWSMPAWEDALGARHAEVLFVLENRGTDPVEVVARESRFSVGGGTGAGAGRELAAGRLAAVIPPVLGPGERGYAFAAFLVPGPAAEARAASVELGVRRPASSLVELRVRDARLDTSGPTLEVAGTARNAGAGRSTGGMVGAVILDASGRPLAAVVDAASAEVLAPGERRAFSAADPAIPVDRIPRGTVVAHGWATLEATGAGAVSPGG